jgi:tRNA modification GTPase
MTALLDGLRKRVEAQLIVDDSATVANERQRKCLMDMTKHLKSAQESNRSGLELIAEELRAATDAVGRLTGRIDVEDVLGEIFSRFCIGK